MKYTTLLLLLLITLCVTAGDKAPSQRFYAGASINPGVCYRLLTRTSTGQVTFYDSLGASLVLKRRNSTEHPSLALLTGFKAGYRVTGFLSIEAGIEYGLMQYQYKQPTDYLTFPPAGGGIGYDTAYLKYRYVYRSHQLNIPVGLNFTIGKKKVKGIITTGAALNILVLRQKIVYRILDGNTTGRTGRDNSPWNKINLSPFIAAGIEVAVAEIKTGGSATAVLLRITPTAQIQALKEIDTPLTERLWSAGINTSVLFQFGKTE